MAVKSIVLTTLIGIMLMSVVGCCNYIDTTGDFCNNFQSQQNTSHR